jgi:prepilin-type processing-associated H-X9-DG protein
VVKIEPYIEEQALYDKFDHTKASNARENADVVADPLPWLICPSDSDAPPGGLFRTLEKQDGANTNPNPGNGAELVMGLWYPVSAGPTNFDGCPFCPTDLGPSPNMCCQGESLGSRPVPRGPRPDPIGPPGTIPSFAGLFGRWEKGLKITEITDGMTHTIMAGETISSHCKYQCAHCPNFPIAPTNTPINWFLRTPLTLPAGGCATDTPDLEEGGYCESCGYKSRHPGGAHLLMADGTVQFISESIDFEFYYLLGARKSGELKRLK